MGLIFTAYNYMAIFLRRLTLNIILHSNSNLEHFTLNLQQLKILMSVQ